VGVGVVGVGAVVGGVGGVVDMRQLVFPMQTTVSREFFFAFVSELGSIMFARFCSPDCTTAIFLIS
jgi:hypothetical protein